MRKVLLVPDSFKGTMTSKEICGIMEEAVHKWFPDAEVVSIPVADGGEGSVDCFLTAVGGSRVTLSVKGPYFEDMEGFYGILPDNTAVIEMAAAAGLPLVGENRHAEKTTTYGAGQLILDAVKTGCKKIILGLGGSATNDGGTGAAAALGVRFLNASGKPFIPVGETLCEIHSIDTGAVCPEVRNMELVIMCDIDNPLCGPQGAAAVFGPQKGADPDMVQKLDANLAHLAGIIQRDLGRDIAELPGAGAAGGMGGGMAAFFNGKLQMGIETVLDTVKFNDLLREASLVFTGEGKIDNQSLRGKVVIGVARRAKKTGVPVIAVVGDIGDNIKDAYDEGVTSIFSINRVAVPYQEAKRRSKIDLLLTMDNLMRFFQAAQFPKK